MWRSGRCSTSGVDLIVVGETWVPALEHGSKRALEGARASLRLRTDERRATEVAVATLVLNRMLKLGRPSYVRIA
jgi:hypothetical protein